MIRSVGSQLSELGIGTRQGLIEEFRKSKPIPETGTSRGARYADNQGDEPHPAPNENDGLADQPNAGPTEQRTEPPIDEEQSVCERLLDKLILSVATLTTARNAFNVLIARRPVTKLNPVKIRLLKETLQSVKEILDQLPD